MAEECKGKTLPVAFFEYVNRTAICPVTVRMFLKVFGSIEWDEISRFFSNICQ